jgi:small subunit ribosomal protein S36
MTTAAGRRAGPVPAAVWVLVGVQLLLGVGWSLLAPLYRAPDEPQHMDLVLVMARGEGYPGPYDRRMGAQVIASAQRANLPFDDAAMPDRSGRFTAAEAPGRGQRPAFAALAPDEPTDLVNQMPQHGPAYYAVAGAAVGALPAATAWDAQVWLVRVLTALLVAPLPLLAWLTAARVVPDGRVALAAAAVPLVVPQLAHVAGSVNNDGLLILTYAAATAVLAGVAAGDLRLRTAATAGLLAGLALLTKGFALSLYGVAAVAYAVPAWRRRRAGEPLAPALLGLGLTAAVATAVGGWWWVRNTLR